MRCFRSASRKARGRNAISEPKSKFPFFSGFFFFNAMSTVCLPSVYRRLSVDFLYDLSYMIHHQNQNSHHHLNRLTHQTTISGFDLIRMPIQILDLFM